MSQLVAKVRNSLGRSDDNEVRNLRKELVGKGLWSKDHEVAYGFREKAVRAFKVAVGARKKPCVADAAQRGVTLAQIEQVWEQIEARCLVEGWVNVQGQKLTPDTVNLYDVCRYIILPTTLGRQCSYVELVCEQAQPPDYFVSHWWGESVKRFLACLQQHARDHRETDAVYWVCAYSNNQWSLDSEVNLELKETSFFRAMQLSKGMVTVLDSQGVVFNRLWCGYELFVSLVERRQGKISTRGAAGYAWSVYSYLPSREMAVGLCEGRAPIDRWPGDKWLRERLFPPRLLMDATSIDITNAQASRSADKERILWAIGGNAGSLNKTLNSRFAAAGLRVALEDPDGDEMFERFLHAIKVGQATNLSLDFGSSERMDFARLGAHLPWDSLTDLDLVLNSNAFGERNDVFESLLAWPFNKVHGSVSLNLAGNRLGASHADALASVFSFSSLSTLNVRGNKLGDDGAAAIARGFQNFHACIQLDLRECKISDSGVRALASALEHHKSLRELELSSNFIKDVGAAALGKAIETNDSLERLLLGYNQIGPDGGIALAKGLRRNACLKVLELRTNDLGVKGAQALGQSLGANSTITRLGLYKNKIGDEGAMGIAAGLAANKALQQLDLSSNEIDATGAAAIADALERNETLLGVNMYGMTPAGERALRACPRAVVHPGEE